MDPVTGAYTAGPVPADAGPCSATAGCSCAPSIATTPLCRADGTSVLVVVRSDCADCDTPASDPAVVGWIDPATGVFTPGAAPADAVPCEALTCATTVCRQRCDDTDGDGQPDATYSELWCVHVDGTADLVLTYQDDPAVPYTPVAPVDCEYANETSDVLTLCDDTGPFLRRYSWLGDTAAFEDVELDGTTPHVVTGTVGVCSAAATDCEAQTTPAATLGLCLADGTPIAVVVTRDCTGTVTQDGWINLTTGTYSAGDPPAGTMACGNPRSISTTGTFCDVDPASGDVLGLVLIEYTYGADGAVAAVRLVDATTGTTYVPQGEVTTCPAGVAQPERDLVQLCDTATDGTVTEFVRDFARDENGQITGHTDYLLDGTPYTPSRHRRPVRRHVPGLPDGPSCATPSTSPRHRHRYGLVRDAVQRRHLVGHRPRPLPTEQAGRRRGLVGRRRLPQPDRAPLTRWTFNQPVTVDFSVAVTYSTGTAPSENQVQVPPGAIPLSLPSGYTYNQATGILRVDSTLTECRMHPQHPYPRASRPIPVDRRDHLRAPVPRRRNASAECQRFGTWEFGALDVSLGGPFLRTVCRDCTGAVTSNTDTLLDGATPYTPLGLVGVASPRPATRDRSSRTPRSCSSATSPRTARPRRSCVASPTRRESAPRPSRTPRWTASPRTRWRAPLAPAPRRPSRAGTPARCCCATCPPTAPRPRPSQTPPGGRTTRTPRAWPWPVPKPCGTAAR